MLLEAKQVTHPSGRSGQDVKITYCSTAKHFFTLALILFSCQTEGLNLSNYTKSIKFFFPSFRRLSPNECLTKSLEMSFLLAIFKFCTTNHWFNYTERQKNLSHVSENFSTVG